MYIDRGLVFRGQNSQTVSIGFINWQNLFEIIFLLPFVRFLLNLMT